MATADSSYRYESKFVADTDRPFVESVVRFHPALFRSIYHRRWVNNIYLDTWTLESYEHNAAGASQDRVKVRIRWYGDLWGPVENPVLELKIRQGLVNRKASFPLDGFVMADGLMGADVTDLLRRSQLPPSLRHDLLKLQPTLVNRYSRNYFRTPDRAFRITIDSDLAYHAIRHSAAATSRRWCSGDGIILELKYAQDVAKYAEGVTQHFPFRLSRSSKYANGIECTGYRFGRGGTMLRITPG